MKNQVKFNNKINIKYAIWSAAFLCMSANISFALDLSDKSLFQKLAKSFSFGPYSTEKPKKVKQADGKTARLFQLKQGRTRTLYTVSTSGKLYSKKKFTTVKSLYIGDFITEAGEEIAIQKTNLTSYSIFNPFTKKSYDINIPAGTPITNVNVNDLIGITPTPISTTPPGPTIAPPPTGVCVEKSPNDGNEGYLWKPTSDTQTYAVTLLPSVYTGSVDHVELTTTADQLIELLRYKGIGNGNRTHWISGSQTGSSLKNKYGSIKVRAIFDNGGCLTYKITDPSRRTD